ncbi:NAD(P)-dependent oxidoreductase [Agrobacterium arsenijevicii]|uniref:NAD(P)-dependent oxidoreductase n=1 Tax=Agrobacterium arsenijevicii TaxID=1585697 RepID=UPI0006961551
MQVGLIGLGRMGIAIAHRLRGSGFSILGWDIDPVRRKAAAQGGCPIAETPKEVARQAEIILSVVTDDAAVNWLFTSTDGFLEIDLNGKTFVEMSTVRPATVRKLSFTLEPRGAALIGAPVLGSIPAVLAGQLLILAGGRAEDIQRVGPVLAALAHSVVHMGPIGAGNAMKLVVNLSLGAYLASLTEGLALGSAQGLDLEKMLGVLSESPTANSWLTAKIPALRGQEGETSLDILALRKDLMSAVATGTSSGVPMPLAAGVLSTLTAAVAAGNGYADLAQLPRLFREQMLQESAATLS